MRQFSAAAWAAIEAKTTAQERNQALSSQFSGPCTIDFLDGDGEIIRTVSAAAWTVQQQGTGYRAVPGLYTDAAVGEGIPEVAVFRSGGTEVFRVDCSVQIDATYRLAGNIAAGVPIRRGDFGIGVLPRVSGGATAPVVVQAPSIAGEAKVGALLVATPGQYSGNPAPTVTRQWIVGGAVLAGESGPTYTVRAVDVGKSVGYRETASNGIGSAVIANSNYIGPVVAGALQFTGPALIQIEQGGTYSLAQHAAGGTPPYAYSHTGALPSGVTLNPSTGILSATAGATITTSGDIDFHVDDGGRAAGTGRGASGERHGPVDLRRAAGRADVDRQYRRLDWESGADVHPPVAAQWVGDQRADGPELHAGRGRRGCGDFSARGRKQWRGLACGSGELRDCACASGRHRVRADQHVAAVHRRSGRGRRCSRGFPWRVGQHARGRAGLRVGRRRWRRA